MLKQVPLKSLKLANFNPKSRTRDVRPLIRSIERVGLLVPILITKDNDVVDGHRRAQAAARMGWEAIPAIVVDGDQAELFSEVNTQKKPLTGNESLHVYLVNAKALSGKARLRMADMEEALGKPLIKQMAKDGFSLATYNVAKRVATEADASEMLADIVRWVMKFRCAQLARKALQAGTPASKLIAAVKNDKPLRVSFVSA
jgi:hypothetical protein